MCVIACQRERANRTGKGEVLAQYMKVQYLGVEGLETAKWNVNRGEVNCSKAKQAQIQEHRHVHRHAHFGQLLAGLRLVR